MESGATMRHMDDEERTPTNEDLHVIPLPPRVNQYPLPAMGHATIENARGSSVTHNRYVRCTAHSKWTGNQCRKWAVNGSTVCYIHGAAIGTPARIKADERISAQYEEWLEEVTLRSMDGISDILENPEDQKVLLSAAKDVLDRAGHSAVKKTLNMNAQVDIDAEIEELMAKGHGPDQEVMDV